MGALGTLTLTPRAAGGLRVTVQLPAGVRNPNRVAGVVVRRPPFRRRDRMLLAPVSRILPKERMELVRRDPRTLLRWHRELVRRNWTYRRRGPGRPALDQETVELITRLARENPRWGTSGFGASC